MHAHTRPGATRYLALLAVAAGMSGAIGPVHAYAAAATPVATFAYTGAEQTYAVPAGAVAVTITAVGGPGGAGSGGTAGGSGAAVTATVWLPAGTTTLFVEVGGAGTTAPESNADGFNGGGGSGIGGGGGGASDVRTCSVSSCADLNTNDSRLVVAGGGGGGGADGGCGALGGTAGDALVSGPGSGGAGGDPCHTALAGGGGGLGGFAGGAGGAGTLNFPFTGTSGSRGQGGFAPIDNDFENYGGGGGGGYFGGGAAGDGSASGGGGGAGSSFWVAGATGTSMTEDASGTPRIVIRAVTATTVASSANPLVTGGQVTYTAAVSPVPDGGTVAFEDAGAAITGCESRTVDATTGKASCQVSYATTGSHAVTAVYSGDAAFTASTSAGLTEQVAYAVKLLYDTTKANNGGATVPIKLQLVNSTGSNVSASGITLTVTGLSPNPAPGVVPSGSFAFMTLDEGPGYQVDVMTKGFPAATYMLSFTASGDPTTHTAAFVVS